MKIYAGSGINKISEGIWKIMCIGFEYIIALLIVSPLLGTLLAYFDLPWRWRTIIPILAVAVIIAFCIHKLRLFTINGWKELCILLAVLSIGAGIYSEYSPVLEIRQDPGLYMYRALNLVNYGYVYEPVDIYTQLQKMSEIKLEGVEEKVYNKDNILVNYSYGKVQNGTYLEGNKLYVDFYPGGSFFYAIIGKVHKPFIFYGQTIIMLAVIWVLYFVMKALAQQKDPLSNALCVILFAVSPIIVWFGRGSFSEPVALFFFLFIILVLLRKEIEVSGVVLILALCASYTARIDFISLMALGAFLIFYADLKLGIIYGTSAFVSMYFIQNTYPLYYSRITSNDMPVLRYGFLLIAAGALLGAVIGKWGKKAFDKLVYAGWVKNLALAVGVLLTLTMFLDNIIPEQDYSYAISYGQYIRTYSESIMELLFLVFPGVVLVSGFIGIHTLLDRKNKLAFIIFICGSVLATSSLLFGANNSPQLYWVSRRYMSVLLPGVFLGFVSLLQKLEKEVRQIICLVCMMLSLNMLFNSNQVVNYEGLDQAVIEVEKQLKDKGYDTVYYTNEIKMAVSPLRSYSDIDFVLIKTDMMQSFFDYIADKDTSGSVFITDLDMGPMEYEEHALHFVTQGESYGSIPKEAYSQNTQLKVYKVDEIKECKAIYPGIYTRKAVGFDKDGWNAGYSVFYTYENTRKYDQLIVEMNDFYNYNIERNSEDYKIRAKINGEYMLTASKFEDNRLYYDISGIPEKVSKIELFCPTFNLKKLGLGEDSRNLGINVLQLYYR